MSYPNRIIIGHDQPSLASRLKPLLGAYDYEVDCIGYGGQLDHVLRRGRHDLLVLGLSCPPDYGLSICQRLRDAGISIPILMLTESDDPVDRARSLENGADGYLATSFYPCEFIACIRALLRRQQLARGEPDIQTGEISFGEFRFELASQRLHRAGTEMELHASQSQLLRALAASANRPISRHNLVAQMGRRNDSAGCRNIDIRIRRLRQIVEDDPSSPRFVRTVWGTGYMLQANVIR
ncbi:MULTISPECIES: winged helix-turn-helix domain-containing protein [Paraburkholderia]|uniref:winged helix-turn-helix domain-containing protein n=1 Tax=Paraburkholderia TaxID=1822464 RepID=UPI0022591D18|nr:MULTISPECIES: winged helix-turn-helix domain-containing protein [Paraburkholderia]MCX4159638.1 winged helix-turn-helix domain-containing protein [Paraburkholderia aspalathi]MDN7169036.1 winged helix-turn-helix domain-containing protein [Paraburkholderia sp. SECH2]MDQ6397523.1 winged helix-turn-helix domain-containing protein [Paraburkholderia aspalathi]